MGTDQDFSGFIKENKSLAKEYVETRITLAKLQAVKVLSRSLGMLIALAIVSFLALFVVLFLGMSFAWWIAKITESNAVGFASAAGLFLAIVLLVIAFRKQLFQDKLVELFIRETVKDLHDHEKD